MTATVVATRVAMDSSKEQVVDNDGTRDDSSCAAGECRCQASRALQRRHKL